MTRLNDAAAPAVPAYNRREERHSVHVDALLERSNGDQIFASTVNVSGSGLLVQVHAPTSLALGEVVACGVRLYEDKPYQSWGLGRIIRLEDQLVAVELPSRPDSLHEIASARAAGHPAEARSVVREQESGDPAVSRLRSILVVDDDPVSGDLVRRILVAEGFEARAVRSAAETVRALSRGLADLVLLDPSLSDRSGFDLCSDLKSDRALQDVPVIFLSSLDDRDSRLHGLRVGAVDYITKPFYAEEVIARVRIHLRMRQALICAAKQQEMRLAELREAQQSILVRPEDLPQAAFAVCSRPLAEVGGDIYDVQQLGAGVFSYFVGDLSGHGVGASFLTPAVQALLRQFSAPIYSAGDTMRGVNATIASLIPEGQYLTASYVRYFQGKNQVSITSAGHPTPILITADGSSTTFALEGDPLGVFPAVILGEQTARFLPGDRLFLYTDGLIEDYAQSCGGRTSGVDRLRWACLEYRDMPLQGAVRAIVDVICPRHARQADDILLLALEARA